MLIKEIKRHSLISSVANAWRMLNFIHLEHKPCPDKETSASLKKKQRARALFLIQKLREKHRTRFTQAKKYKAYAMKYVYTSKRSVDLWRLSLYPNDKTAFIPLAFEAAWVLATLVQPNQIVSLYSGASFAWGLHASSIPLGIAGRKTAQGFKIGYQPTH